jgi:hypothetical protein
VCQRNIKEGTVRRHISPGVIVAVIAVVVAMSGSAYAASKITGAQIKDGTITSADIRNHSLKATDLSGGVVRGAQGPMGPAGPSGPSGPAGLPGVSGIQTVESPHISLVPGGFSPSGWVAQCPPGKVVIGTGWDTSVATPGFVKAYGTFVGAFVYNDSSIVVSDIHVQAICATASGAVASSARPDKSRYNADRRRAIAHETR